jgi:hypothetical protein
MADRTYHLWRDYEAAPFRRWACDVVPDTATEDGYKITDYDPNVADGVFLHRLREHMAKPTTVHLDIDDAEGIADGVTTAHPKEPKHFAEAIRIVPGAHISGEGRA